MKNAWNIVHDCDEENGNPTCWATEINSLEYGRFAWIEKNAKGGFDVVIKRGILKTCKTMASAKRWVSMYIV